MNRSHRAALPALAAVAALALAVSACSSGSSGSGSKSGGPTASAPGITATTITIGSHQPLTGVAAPGYDEIAPTSNAYFQYVNAHGGIYGRKIVYKYLDDKYDPTDTVSVVKQLVLQDNVYAIFDGLGTPTHLAVAPFLNSSKVPDVFVASGCECWNAPSTLPETFGWQLDYVREGKILGTYIKKHFAGQKIGYFFQDDEFGKDGVKGLDDRDPARGRGQQAELRPDEHQRRPAGGRAQGVGGQGRRVLQRPGLHRTAQAEQPQARLQPDLRGQRRGLRPDHPGRAAGGLRQAGRRHGVGQPADPGHHHRRLPAHPRRHEQQLGRAVQEDPRQVPAQAALRRQRGVRRGGRVHLRPGHAQGGQEPDPGRPGQGDPGGLPQGPPWRPTPTPHPITPG